MREVYVIMESVDGRQIPRVVYDDKERALHWIGGACSMEGRF